MSATNYTVIATTICRAGHTNDVPAGTVLEDGSCLFGDAYHFCLTCDEPNDIGNATFRKVELATA